MLDTPKTTANKTAPATQIITAGRRVRLIHITPVCLINLTGTTQARPGSRTRPRTRTALDVLLDESSTEALRRDPRVDNTTKIRRPDPSTKRALLTSIPTDYMILAENDS